MSIPELQTPELIICADWSANPGGRSAWAVDVRERAVFPLADRSTAWTLEAVIAAAGSISDQEPALIAIDAPIGIPESLLRAGAASDFVSWLGQHADTVLANEPAVAPEEWSVERPFFRVQKGEGGLTRFVNAAAAAGVELWRGVDRLTGAKSMFAIGIPGHVGPATRSLWSEIRAARSSGVDLALWPFESGDGQPSIAEIYPRAAYGVALATDLPAPPRRLSKTKAETRGDAMTQLEQARWYRGSGIRLYEPERPRTDEDDFDACLTGVALLRLLLDEKPLATKVDPVAEGAMLGV